MGVFIGSAGWRDRSYPWTVFPIEIDFLRLASLQSIYLCRMGGFSENILCSRSESRNVFLATQPLTLFSIKFRTSRNLASLSPSIPTNLAGSSNDQFILVCIPSQIVGQILSASSHTVTI